MKRSHQLILILSSLMFLCGHCLHTSTQTVAIICSNDFHGNVFPYQTFRSDTKQKYLYGGLQYMAQMVETVEQEYAGNVLYLDAGDQFQGGIESSSSVSSGEIINDYFNDVKTHASALGNHQFDFGPKFLINFMQDRGPPSVFISANLRSQKGESNFLPNLVSSKLFQLKSGIRIGVVGITVTKTKQQMNKEFPKYDFLDYKPVILKQVKKLRETGANAIVLLAHLGDNCTTNDTFGIWKEDTYQQKECSGSITDLLKQLPKGTIDAVAQGHIHVLSHHFVNGIPIAGTNNGGFYFNIIYLTFRHGKITDRSIEGPIPVCQKVFKNTGTCGYLSDQRLDKAGPLVEWKFHGRKVRAHPKVEKRLQNKWQPLMKPYNKVIAHNQLYLYTDFFQQTPLSNLVLDLFAKAVQSKGEKVDFGFINAGSFRWMWIPGDLTERHFINMFPYAENNKLITFDFTGQELMDTLKAVQSTDFYYPTYNLQQTIQIKKNKKKKYLGITFLNGDPIHPHKIYRGFTRNAVLDPCRDAFCQVVNRTYTLKNRKVVGEFDQILRQQLKKLGTIPKQGLIDQQRPHLIVFNKGK